MKTISRPKQRNQIENLFEKGLLYVPLKHILSIKQVDEPPSPFEPLLKGEDDGNPPFKKGIWTSQTLNLNNSKACWLLAHLNWQQTKITHPKALIFVTLPWN